MYCTENIRFNHCGSIVSMDLLGMKLFPPSWLVAYRLASCSCPSHFSTHWFVCFILYTVLTTTVLTTNLTDFTPAFFYLDKTGANSLRKQKNTRSRRGFLTQAMTVNTITWTLSTWQSALSPGLQGLIWIIGSFYSLCHYNNFLGNMRKILPFWWHQNQLTISKSKKEIIQKELLYI